MSDTHMNNELTSTAQSTSATDVKQPANENSLAVSAGSQPIPNGAAITAEETNTQQSSSKSKIGHAVRWILAAFGAAAVFAAIQLVVTMVVMIIFELTWILEHPAILQQGGVDGMTLVDPVTMTSPHDDSSYFYTLYMTSMLVIQIVSVLVFALWWRFIKKRSLVRASARPIMRGAGYTVARAFAIVFMGLALQLGISLALTYLLPLAPSLNNEYSELLKSPLMSDFSLISLLVVAIGAPFVEELACRGIMLEFALRAFNPQLKSVWQKARNKAQGTPVVPDGYVQGNVSFVGVDPSKNVASMVAASAQTTSAASKQSVPSSAPADQINISTRAFWCANIVQALLFGILHGNIVQGSYAFVMGLVLGWLVRKTGKLSYGIGLHFVVNFSANFVGLLTSLTANLGAFGDLIFGVLALLLMAQGVALFLYSTKPKDSDGASADACDELTGPSLPEPPSTL